MSPRSRTLIAVAAAAVLVLLFVPWSRRTIRAESVLRPVARATLGAPEDAMVAQVLVREGDTVSQGQPLIRLQSPDATEQEERLALEQNLFEKETSRARESGDPALAFQASQRATSAAVGLRSSESRRGYLLLKSPISGQVLTHRPEDLAGRFVVEGAGLLEIGDTSRMAAEVGVSERLLSYLKPGAPVAALVRTSPMGTRRGTVERISSATAGAPSTVRDGAGPNAPTGMPDRFTVLAVFDNADGELLPGAAARVKIRSDREAYALRAWRVFWRWLRTIVW